MHTSNWPGGVDRGHPNFSKIPLLDAAPLKSRAAAIRWLARRGLIVA